MKLFGCPNPYYAVLLPDRAFSAADIKAYDSRRKEIRSEHAIDGDAAVIDGQEALRSEVSASKHEFRHRVREGFRPGRPGADASTDRRRSNHASRRPGVPGKDQPSMIGVGYRLCDAIDDVDFERFVSTLANHRVLRSRRVKSQ